MTGTGRNASGKDLRETAVARDWRGLVLPMLGAALVLTFAATQNAGAATYKWVDEKGVVHYTDKIPSEAVNKGSTMLDKQARPVKKIEPTATAEQIRMREAEEENRRLLAKANEEIARRDRALLSSYTTEAEIDLARSRAVGTIDAQIESSVAYTLSLTKRREDLDKQKAKFTNAVIPVALERELEGNDSELEKTAALIDQKRRERAAVVARYEADKGRWRELRSIADANAGVVPRGTHPAATVVNSNGTATPRK